jgi:hypothetical protein
MIRNLYLSASPDFVYILRVWRDLLPRVLQDEKVFRRLFVSGWRCEQQVGSGLGVWSAITKHITLATNL